MPFTLYRFLLIHLFLYLARMCTVHHLDIIIHGNGYNGSSASTAEAASLTNGDEVQFPRLYTFDVPIRCSVYWYYTKCFLIFFVNRTLLSSVSTKPAA